jgi:tRNA (adenine22-N1)-methyltransferase
LKLPERLARIAVYVTPGAPVADIGTDHALLPVYLVKQEISPRVIAGELHPGPLQSARSTVAFYGLDNQIQVREGDGLQVLRPGEADVIVIAGMGGVKIRDILEASPAVLERVKRLILQPIGGAGILRDWLLSHCWSLMDEDLVLEGGRFYEIIIAEPGPSPEAEEKPLENCRDFEPGLYLEIGPRLVKKAHPLLVPFLEKQVQEMDGVIKALERARTPAARQMQRDWIKKMEFFKRVIACQLNAKPS